MDQQPQYREQTVSSETLITQPISVNSGPKKRKTILIAAAIFAVICIVSIAAYIFLINNKEEPTQDSPLATAERYVLEGNNAVSIQDKLKFYNSAKKIYYENGKYERVVTVYESALRGANKKDPYYAYLVYYVADAYFKSSDLESAIKTQETLVSLYENKTYIKPVPKKEAISQLAYLKQLYKSSQNADFSIKVSDEATPSD